VLGRSTGRFVEGSTGYVRRMHPSKMRGCLRATYVPVSSDSPAKLAWPKVQGEMLISSISYLTCLSALWKPTFNLFPLNEFAAIAARDGSHIYGAAAPADSKS
jgi:hypothetical protein